MDWKPSCTRIFFIFCPNIFGIVVIIQNFLKGLWHTPFWKIIKYAKKCLAKYKEKALSISSKTIPKPRFQVANPSLDNKNTLKKNYYFFYFFLVKSRTKTNQRHQNNIAWTGKFVSWWKFYSQFKSQNNFDCIRKGKTIIINSAVCLHFICLHFIC